MLDPKERFSDRVDDYERYRPGYPQGLYDVFLDPCGVGPGKVAADVGSGTGILTRVLLATGARVIGVEPNGPMRAAAERSLSGEALFVSIDGCAEATGFLRERSTSLRRDRPSIGSNRSRPASSSRAFSSLRAGWS